MEEKPRDKVPNIEYCAFLKEFEDAFREMIEVATKKRYIFIY
jgi:hypothetical protein